MEPIPGPSQPYTAGRMRNRVASLREDRNWSQAELARQLGVSRQTVNAVENDRHDPSLNLAFKMSRVFGFPIEDLFLPDLEEPGEG